MDIAKTGNVHQLLIKGEATKEQLVDAFEKIVCENGKQNGDFKYNSYFALMKGYAELIARYTVTKVLLTKLGIQGFAFLDFAAVMEIRERGHVVNLENETKFVESLYSISRQVDNLVTKARSKQKEMEKLAAAGQSKSEQSIFDIIANTNFGLGGNYININSTLAEYNAWKKVLRQKVTNMQKQSKGRVAYG